MLRHDFSQLAVMSGKRQLIGAVSWESIAKASLTRHNLSLAHVTIGATLVAADDDLIALVPTIVGRGFVFVGAADQTLSGIVTTADLGEQFGTLAKPFLLIGEIERRLRQILAARFEFGEIADVEHRGTDARAIESVHDLTLGETTQVFAQKDLWERLGWDIERAEFVKALDEVREIRNDVMHFSPDPLSPDQELALHNFVAWLRVMEPTT